jgi:hypothetical protein
LRAAIDIQLLQDGRHMRLHRRFRYGELLRNLLIE